MFRRETIIALRARHQAYRIASEILYPHVEAPPPPSPRPGNPRTSESELGALLISPAVLKDLARRRRWEAISTVLMAFLISIALLLAFVTFIVNLANWTR